MARSDATALPGMAKPCPRLFPSFTVTAEREKKYMEIARKVTADTYLPEGYRRKPAAPFKGIVENVGRYFCAASPLRPGRDDADTFRRKPVRRTDRYTGAVVEYATAEECARLNHRALRLLYEQIRRGPSHTSRYRFEVVEEERSGL